MTGLDLKASVPDTPPGHRQPDGHRANPGQHRSSQATPTETREGGPAQPIGDTMTTRTDRQSPALHVADSHDLIRVHGARENNLKDVSVELPKRRLTVFTGVFGSGKSSLLFGTIAAESQRLINETYSAFVKALCRRWRGRRSTCWRG
jgi:hypothetical protein